MAHHYFLNPSDYLVEFNPAQIHLENRAFLYGDGGFTTAKLKNGEIIYWQRHTERLMKMVQRLKLNIKAENIEYDYQVLKPILQDIQHATVKIILSRGVAQRGYALPQSPAQRYWCIYPTKTQQPSSRLHILKHVGVSPLLLGQTMPILKGLKTLNRMEQVMQKAYADSQGWQEALCLDTQHHIVEGISSNCFFYDEKQWVTPDLALSGVEGTMRQEILQRMRDADIRYKIAQISLAQLKQMQAGFFCNALNPMQPIENIQLQQQDKLFQVQFCLKPCMMLAERLQLHQLN